LTGDVDVGAVGDFGERDVRIVQAGDREIGIVRWGGSVYAVANVCPHQRGPVCRGTLGGRLTGSAPGTMQVDDETPVLGCPWHGWEFDLRTGRALWDDRYGVRTFPARVEGGRVLVELRSPRS
jgi:nitrite reductase/ring-hydroxylating ferredoxin subunit